MISILDGVERPANIWAPSHKGLVWKKKSYIDQYLMPGWWIFKKNNSFFDYLSFPGCIEFCVTASCLYEAVLQPFFLSFLFSYICKVKCKIEMIPSIVKQIWWNNRCLELWIQSWIMWYAARGGGRLSFWDTCKLAL